LLESCQIELWRGYMRCQLYASLDRLPVVAPLAPRAGRLREVPAGRDLRGMDEAPAGPQRLVSALPGLWPGNERIPVAEGRPDARGTRLWERVEPSVRSRRATATGGLLAAGTAGQL
jgi:hypothetical protein